MRRPSATGAFVLGAAQAIAAEPVPPDGVIVTPGSYLLEADRTSEEPIVLRIEAEGVTLDLGGNVVRCAPSDPATAVTFGIKVEGGGAIIRNGAISGCSMGIHAADIPDVTVEGVDFTASTYIGLHGGSVVRDSVFADITGYSDEPYAIGINLPQGGCVIENNTFRNLHRQPGVAADIEGEGVGVLLAAHSAGCTIRDNRFENAQPGQRPSIGIWAGDAGATIAGNVFTNFGRGVAASPDTSVEVHDNRFLMREPQATSYAIGAQQGSATGNVISGYETPVSGDIPQENNLILPRE